ncbi:MAG: chitobiase/beta-hexosaminidase C-terminal domain-containing protein [Terracidiphilus sp.]
MKSTQSRYVYASVGASNVVKTLCLISCLVLFLFAGFASGQANPQYGDCSVTTVGSPAYGPNPLTGEYGGQLNGFLPFPADSLYNQNISGAAVDPNSAVLINYLATAGSHNHVQGLFGSSPADGSIPYYVVDSSVTPTVPVIVTGSPTQSEVTREPYPDGDFVPIEGDTADCSVWPDTDAGDQHSLVLDKHTCWIYEAWVASRCIGSDNKMYWENNSMTLFDAQNYNARPWGWTSADAAGESIYSMTWKYEEAASGVISHPTRFTVSPSYGDSHGGYFLTPGTHAASSTADVPASGKYYLPEGAQLRLNLGRLAARLATVTNGGHTAIDQFSTLNQTLLTGLANYGMVMDDNGTNFYVIGDTDPRWNDNDEGDLHQILVTDFDVIQMAPEYASTVGGALALCTGLDYDPAGTAACPGMDSSTALADYPETLPSISSYSANGSTGTITVNPGAPVTFNFCVTGTNWNANYTATNAKPYAYIDEVGPQRLDSSGCGSATVTPTITQEYTLYALNAAGRAPSSTINVVVTGAPLTPAAPVLVPPPGTYASDSLKVTPFTSTWAPTAAGAQNASYFYTTATGNSNTPPTTTTPLPTEAGGTAGDSTTKLGTSATASVTVTKAASGGVNGYEVICVIATVPAISTSYGNSNPSPATCGTYVFTGTSTAYADAPIINPPGGTFNTPQAISMSTGSPSSSSSFAEIFFTTDGSTPVAVNGDGNPPGPNSTPVATAADMVYSQGTDSQCYGSDTDFGAIPSCTPTGLVYATNGMTINALTATLNGSTGAVTHSSTVTTATYSVITSNPTFSPAAGNYINSVAVTISDASPQAAIYYTTDGTTPTSSSTPYTVPITITTTTYLQAIAEQPGAANSGVTGGVYTIEVPAQLTTPIPNTSTPLTGTSVAFAWTPGNIATHFELWVGNAGVGSSNLYNSGNVTVDTETVSDLPSNGRTVNVRLYSLINGAWNSTDYTYVATGSPTQAVLTMPAPNTTTPLTGTSVAFSWTPGNVATHFELNLGTSVGSSNLYGSGNVTATTETVSGLPSNGETLYARLYSLINGAWQYTDYTYVATGSPTQAVLTMPAPNTTTPLTGTSVAFSWTPGNLATHFELFAGTSIGSSNLYNSGNVTATTETVSDLPSNGQTVYVRLYSLINGAWQYTDYTYVASGSPTPAALTTPPSPSQFTGTSVTFDWTPGNTATHFILYLGTAPGSSNLYNSGNVTVTTETVNGLPSNGETVYARLYSLINGAWQYATYTYTAF